MASNLENNPSHTTDWLRFLRRVTSSGKFIPEIDGLRFIAIASVLVYHINGEYLKEKSALFPEAGHGFLHELVHTGHFGVQLFFVISGFILGLPFVHHYCHGSKKPSLRKFYIRRFTRIEPPFVINLVIVFLLLVWVKGMSFSQLWPHFGASLFYSHNLMYQRVSDINFVTWSLEIEAQFYLLAPLLAMLLSSRRPILRWGLVAGTAACFAAMTPLLRERWPVVGLTLFAQLPFFLAGFMVAGVYARVQKEAVEPKFYWDLASGCAWSLLAYLLFHRSLFSEVVVPFTVAAAYIFMLKGRISRRALSIPLITTIGGMCYTIYLYHPFLKAALKGVTFGWNVGGSYWINSLFQVLVLGLMIVGCCSVLFAVFERPFMIPDWPARLANVFRRRDSRCELPKAAGAVSEAP